MFSIFLICTPKFIVLSFHMLMSAFGKEKRTKSLFVHSAVCFQIGPNPLTERVSVECHLQLSVSDSTIFFLFSLRTYSSCLCLYVPLLLLFILPSIFSLITVFTRQFLHNQWLIQLAIFIFIVCRVFPSSLTLCNTSSFTQSVQLMFSTLSHHHFYIRY